MGTQVVRPFFCGAPFVQITPSALPICAAKRTLSALGAFASLVEENQTCKLLILPEGAMNPLKMRFCGRDGGSLVI